MDTLVKSESRNDGGTAPRAGSAPVVVIRSVARALDLLETLSTPVGGLTLSELSAQTGLNISTCHHLLATMVARGYVSQNPRSKEYVLGNKIFELSDARARQFNLIEVAMPRLKELNHATGEAVHLAVLQARDLVTVSALESRHAVKVDSGMIGKSNAAHATAVGKAILAWLPDSEFAAIIAAKGMERFTPQTICDENALKEQLRLVRRHGFAEDREEFQPGVICIGAAIRDHTGGVIASLSCSTPMMRASDGVLAELTDRVMASAQELSQELGSRGQG
jgi:IclR family transcriptional regulator, acetate operon repressor